jgi:hypothetical protein
MITAIGLNNNLTLVTANTQESGRVPGLVFENWEVENQKASNRCFLVHAALPGCRRWLGTECGCRNGSRI